MHVTSKEVVADPETRKKYPELSDGTHIITSQLEGDGPLPIASENAKFVTEVLSAVRTSSGGVEVKVAVSIQEPAPVAPVAVLEEVPPTAEQAAAAYLVSKGATEADAESEVQKFGADRILSARDKELDAELDQTLHAHPPSVN